ncbi:hypothetical protein L7F22_026636 [Adiantum nelumboides]|nr:hypothetical protein [Adiantum nelumboides]
MAMDLGIRRGVAARMVEIDAATPDDWQQVLTGHRDMPLHVGSWASFDPAGRPLIARYGSLIYGVEANISIQQARECIWLVDSKGLVVKSRMDALENHKLPFAKDFPPHHDLISSVKAVRPTALLGLSGTANCFTKEVCEAMATFNKRPIIFALSHPTTPECTAEQAYTWTQGQCVFASGSHSHPVEVNGRLYHAGQGNSSFVFPGIGLGCVLAGATRIRDEMFLAAADALASQVTNEDRELGLVYPPLNRIRETSTHVAKAVANMAYKLVLRKNHQR